MANQDNPIILISETDGIYCSHNTDSSGTAYGLTCSDNKPNVFGSGRCVTETRLDRELSTCSCGLFVWRRVPAIELFNSVSPQVMQEVGNHLPMTDKQKRYINVLFDKIERRYHMNKIDDALVDKLTAQYSTIKNRGEASRVIDALKEALGE